MRVVCPQDVKKMLLKQARMSLGGTGQPHTRAKSYREKFGWSQSKPC